MLRFKRRPVVGQDGHRSGWPYALGALKPLRSTFGLLFDDFVEQTFLYGFTPWLAHRSSWIGVFHHPPNIPEWYPINHQHWKLGEMPVWRRSQGQLRLAITLGPNLAEYLEREFGVPTVVIRHPSETPQIKWHPDRWLASQEKCIVQIGWYMRNTHAIYQLRVPDSFRRRCLEPQQKWFRSCHQAVARHWHPDRPRYPGVDVVRSFLDDRDYDFLLSRSIVFLELIDSVANNTVLECIARHTPLLVNRTAGTVFYLGAEYPLFYDDIDTAAELLTDDRILAAHRYLREMPKQWLDGKVWCESVRSAVSPILAGRKRSRLRLTGSMLT
jgi:hypothetical protein